MYYPYFRGKLNELLALRESADIVASSEFRPIIEPVRESFGGLSRALDSLSIAGARSIVVVNPRYGDHKENGESIVNFLEQSYRGVDSVSPGILLRGTTTSEEARGLIEQYRDRSPAIIHAGFTEPDTVREALGDQLGHSTHIFTDDNMLYRRRFSSTERVLIKDGFEQKRNADYDPVDPFSVLHVVYQDLGLNGYGDFLTVGDRYSESGGPAYAVAIHLTFIDTQQDDAMLVYHFVSDTNDTPTDPARKFSQALSKLIALVDSGTSMLYETEALAEFRNLHERRHFPGLGTVKKLSIRHHLETLSLYHRDAKLTQ